MKRWVQGCLRGRNNCFKIMIQFVLCDLKRSLLTPTVVWFCERQWHGQMKKEEESGKKRVLFRTLQVKSVFKQLIIELFCLGKTFEIMESNCQPHATSLLKPCIHPLKCHVHMCFENLRDDYSTVCLGSLFRCLPTLLVKKFFPICNLNLPQRSWSPFPLVLSLSTWEKQLTPAWLQSPVLAK